MNLHQYRNKIRSQLLGSVQAESDKQQAIATGQYKSSHRASIPSSYGEHYNPGDYDQMVRRMNTSKIPKELMSSYADAGYGNNQGYNVEQEANLVGSGMNPQRTLKKVLPPKQRKAPKQLPQQCESDSDQECDYQGGKFNFVKSIKHVGKEVGSVVKGVASVAKKTGITLVGQEIAKQGVNALKSGAKSFMANAPAIAEATGEIAEEGAPLLLAGAGMKKPRKTRVVSEKEKGRHALIRKLMQQHNCSLAQASKHIKENNLQY